MLLDLKEAVLNESEYFSLHIVVVGYKPIYHKELWPNLCETKVQIFILKVILDEWK